LVDLTVSVALLALSDFASVELAGAAWDAPPTTKKSPATSINAVRPLALIILISPISPVPARTETRGA
jgi:hypothetical protein